MPAELARCSSPSAQTAFNALNGRPLSEAATRTDFALGLYRGALAEGDQCGLLGIAILTSNPPKVDKPKSFATSLGDKWDELNKTLLLPLTNPLGTTAALALFLFVLARLTTSRVVSPGTVSWPKQRRRTTFAVSCLLILFASSCPLLLAATSFGAPVTQLLLAALLAVSLTYTIAVFDDYTKSTDDRFRPPLFLLATLATSTIVAGIGLAMAVQQPQSQIATALAGIASAILGVLLLAVSTGQSLRLVLEVQNSSGVADANCTRYTTTRLASLGSSQLRGLEIPRDTDVTKLPSEALSSLPESKLAKIVMNIVLAIRPGIPWRAQIALHDNSVASISLYRNGVIVGAPLVLTARQLQMQRDVTTEPTKSIVTAALLSAAAAAVLLELSERHTELASGLGGATRPLSLGLHAVATDPGLGLDKETTTRMHAAAVADDPGNKIAVVADLNRLGGDPSREQQEAVARGAEEILNEIGVGEDVLALRYRLAFSLLAARINAYLETLHNKEQEEEEEAEEARSRLSSAATRLVAELDRNERPANLELSRFRAQVICVARYLVDTATSLNAQAEKVPDWARENQLNDTVTKRPFGPAGAYQRACWRAARNRSEQEVIEDLRLAFTEPALRQWAKSDPSFARFRSTNGAPTAFEALIAGPRPTNALDLTLIRPHRKRLENIGVMSGADLLLVPTYTLSRLLDVPRSIVDRWKEAAKTFETGA